MAAPNGRRACRSILWEQSIGAFLKRVGKEYPNPRVAEGRRRLWLKDDLDTAILPEELIRVVDVAGDL